MTTTTTKIWNSGLEYILSAAFEAGIGIENIELRLSASGVTGEGEVHRLMANLAKCGAKVTQNGDVLTVSVSNEQASECLRRDSEKFAQEASSAQEWTVYPGGVTYPSLEDAMSACEGIAIAVAAAYVECPDGSKVRPRCPA